MLLNAINNQSTDFDLFAFEYQPSRIEPDDDWLEVEFHIKKDKDEFHAVDACLTALEVFKIAKWMRDLAQGVPTVKELEFWEPNLRFELNYDYGKSKIIKITFNAELIPPWCPEGEMYEQLCHVGNWQLIQISGMLMAELNDLYEKAGVKQEEGSWKMEAGSKTFN